MLITNDECNVSGIFGRIGLIFIFFFLFSTLHSQEKREDRQIKMEEYPLKVLIISRFFEFVKWPAGSGNNRDSDQFVVGIIGQTPLLDYKKRFHDKIRVPGKTLIITELSGLEQIEGCQAVIIGRSESKRLDEIVAVTENKPILTIGDTEGYGKKGVLINLYRAGRKVKFEINMPAVQRSGLSFSSKLYKLARIIK